MTKPNRQLTHIAMMTTLLVVLGFIPAMPLGFIPVPIVLQNLGIMLAGLLMGSKNGSLSVLLLLLIGLVVPVFSGGTTTIPVLTGPTAGYILSWIFVPILIGTALSKLPKTHFLLTFLVVWVAGVLFVDAIGAFWLAQTTEMTVNAALWANLAFIPGDTIKAMIASLISVRYRHIFKK